MKIHEVSRWMFAACVYSILLSGALMSGAVAQEGAQKPPESAERRLRKIAVHQVRVPHSHARWEKTFTCVYVPKDTSQPYPILIDRTPYSVGPMEKKYKKQIGPSDEFEKARYIVVYQDVRGRYCQKANFTR